MPKRFHTSLCIGATGMLDASLHWIAGQSERCIAVSRHAIRDCNGHPTIHPLDLDWGQPHAFARAIQDAIADHPVDLVLLWMHSAATPARDALLACLPAGQPCLITHVLGSNMQPIDSHMIRPDWRYTTVRLGAIRQADGTRRWLTHDEIAQGTIRAIHDAHDQVIGDV